MFHIPLSNLDSHRIVIAVSSGGQHTVMIAKDKVEKETNGEGAGMEVNNGVNGGAVEKMQEN